MNNILRIISELQQSNYAYLGTNQSCQNYLRSLKYIDELQKFVEDNQWKRSLAIEPNQLKPESEDNQEVMGHLNLSPSKIQAPSRPSHFVPGHRRAKSDGCGMFHSGGNFMMKNVHENYKANYSHHLLDDSKLDEEPPCQTLPADLRYSLRKANESEKEVEKGVMKILTNLRNPGIKCQHQV